MYQKWLGLQLDVRSCHGRLNFYKWSRFWSQRSKWQSRNSGNSRRHGDFGITISSVCPGRLSAKSPPLLSKIATKSPLKNFWKSPHFWHKSPLLCQTMLKNDPLSIFIAFLCDNLFEKCDILEENLVFCLDKIKLMGFTPEKTQKLWYFML